MKKPVIFVTYWLVRRNANKTREIISPTFENINDTMEYLKSYKHTGNKYNIYLIERLFINGKNAPFIDNISLIF